MVFSFAALIRDGMLEMLLAREVSRTLDGRPKREAR